MFDRMQVDAVTLGCGVFGLVVTYVVARAAFRGEDGEAPMAAHEKILLANTALVGVCCLVAAMKTIPVGFISTAFIVCMLINAANLVFSVVLRYRRHRALTVGTRR
jgi:UPF0716 family protein affecting phage T7 exclusion